MNEKEISRAVFESVALEWTVRQRSRGDLPRAVFADIDDTFIDRAGSPAALQAAQDLRNISANTETPLILVSGVGFDAILARVFSGEIPEPEVIVGAVGTDIWLRSKDGDWQKDDAYAAFLRGIGYSPEAVKLLAEEFMSDHSDRGFHFDPNGFGEHKVSLQFLGDDESSERLADVAREHFVPFKIITCKEIHYNAKLPAGAKILKYCMDIVPVTKAGAVEYLRSALGVEAGFKAGDSGNDADMLLAHDPLMPIIVGGSKSELLAKFRPHIVDESNAPFYVLKDGRKVYIETDDSRIAAQSILNAFLSEG